jgi:hypothetical protein
MSNDKERGEDPQDVRHDLPSLVPIAIDEERRKKIEIWINQWFEENKPKRQHGPWPYLLIRAFLGDHGVRPVQTGIFWESPDIIVIQGDVSTPIGHTPTLHPTVGVDISIFVRAWNLGRLSAIGTKLRVSWANPAFNIGDPSSPEKIHYIGGTYINLSDRSQSDFNQIVKIPSLWRPILENNGHECLVAKVESTVDKTGPDFDANMNRHVGQRNLTVVNPNEDITPLIDKLSETISPDIDVEIFGISEHPDNVLLRHPVSLTNDLLHRFGLRNAIAGEIARRLGSQTGRGKLIFRGILQGKFLGGYTIIIQ